MQVLVNGVRLFFDVLGPKLEPHAGHGVLPDAHERTLALLREFIAAQRRKYTP